MDDFGIFQLLQSIKHEYGYDFSGYRKSILSRRIRLFMDHNRIPEISDLISFITEDRSYFQNFVDTITVNVTEIFRDPPIHRFLKEEIFPYLLSYPRVNIWSAGCSTGEEAYTLAVMIKESGLLSKTRIYATDINSKVLNSAKEGIFNQHDILKNTDNYFESGGEKKLDNYYFSKYNKTIFHEDLRNIISVFSHNMTADASFIEAQLIVCSNVLIYFNEQLQKKVLRLFHESLCSSGFLILGPKERVPPDFLGGYFEKVSPELPVFRKINKAFLPAQKKTVPVKLIKDPAFCLV